MNKDVGLKAPFPWFGGKSRVAHLVWERFGDVPNYVEPFAGSLAVLLGRPEKWPTKNELVNDLDCYIANFWRALQADPGAVAAAADWPVNEIDLCARHQWLIDLKAYGGLKRFRDRLQGDMDFHDVKVAGLWVWGISVWIGAAWCQPKDGAVSVQMPRPVAEAGIDTLGVRSMGLEAYLDGLARRLRRVRVCCGGWDRVLGYSSTAHVGTTAVFLDPPYGAPGRARVYEHDSWDVASAVLEYCLANGDDKQLRIALCGYAGEHDRLEDAGWTVVAWKAAGGYGTQGKDNKNGARERIWFSPQCLPPESEAAPLFAALKE